MTSRHVGPVLAAFVLLGGCAEYVDHSDKIYAGAGDANAANLAIQRVDAFPPYRDVTEIRTAGAVAARAQRQYLTGKTAAGGDATAAGSGATTSSEPAPATP
ncbi:hypothetical protein [Jiella sp. M17.18]|uniref:hypothetical protein n=1 Tax=Jiella sp. M17.18 TaxID=3234247 RepID=UPI0034DE721A